jgi:N-methylhydantoinase A
LAVREIIGAVAPDIEVTLSHQINPVIREYHRASAACIDASLKPLMSHFMGQLRGRLADAGFTGRLLVASAGGGLLEPEWLAAAPIHSINSGPALAPVAGRHHAAAETGMESAVIVDAGGTSFDVSVVRGGRIPRTRETWLGDRFVGHITGFPSVDVRTTGAGGGSIASVDPGGLLSVGPLSAGSMPGPVCYGRGGTWPTVTDAAVVLGYLNPQRLAALGIDVDVEGAGAAIEQQIGRPLRLTRDAAATAIIRVLTEQMVHAVEEVTIDQGIDPRNAVLVSGGGAAGFNIVAIAARLGCPRLVIPSSCSALSATGGLLSEISAEHAIALLTTTAAFDFAAVNGALRELSDRCATLLAGSRDGSAVPVVELLAEARYPGQVWELELPLRRARFATPDDLAELSEDFHRLHEEVFAVRDQNSPIEIVGWRARVRGSAGSSGSLVSSSESEGVEDSFRTVHLGGAGSQELPVIELASLTETTGPAIIELPGTTVVLDATAVATRTDNGSMVVIPPRVDRWTAQELIGAR